jgi:ABC-type maltose transport system permease subunit
MRSNHAVFVNETRLRGLLVVLLSLLVQKYIVRGLTMGAVR